MLTGISAWAYQTPVADGIYYLYNETTGLFVSRGAGYGTAVWADQFGSPVKLITNEDGYRLQWLDQSDQYVSDSGWSWADGNDGRSQTYTLSEMGDGKYKLVNKAHTDDRTLYINEGAATGGYSRQIASNGKYGDNCNENWDVWQFLSSSERDELLASRKAAEEAAIAANHGYTITTTLKDLLSNPDVFAATSKTSSITNAELSSNINGWTYTKSSGGDPGAQSGALELYQASGKLTQSVTNLTPGIYKVTLSAFLRDGSNANCVTNKTNGWTMSTAYLEANGVQTMIKDWASDRSSDGQPNDRAAAKTLFNQGKYLNELFVEVGEDGKLDLAICQPGSAIASRWFCFCNVTLTFYSDQVAPEDASAIIAQAEGISGAMNADVKTSLDNALSTFKSAQTIANYNALGEAITAANNSIAAYANAKAYLDEAATILAGTNVYTAEAYADKYTTPLAKYEARTLTDEEGNALVKTSTGWHSNNTIDEILLSAWTIGGSQCHKFDTPLYINTWSTEGATDGSEFLAPFFEYWVGDGDVLGANTIVATVAGLNPNATYSFTIRARVRQTNNKTKIANGVTMKVGAGEAVDISAGAKFGTTSFYIGNFSAVGETDADGKLTMTMTVAENSNISWLSFYNAKWTEGEDLSAYIADYEFAKNTAIANRDNAAYAAVTGKERVDLVNTITTYSAVDVTSKAALIEAKEALEAASNTFVTAAPAYIGIAELNPNVAATLGVALPTITSETVAADLDVNGIIVAEYTAAKTYAQDFTNKLGDWTNAPGNNKGESWKDGNDEYYDLYNAADRAMTQTVTLPKGDYALIAKARASVNGRLTLVVGDETVTYAHKSSTGRGIATDGTATFDPEATYTNNNNGRGWEYRVMTFTSDGATPITLTFNWKTSSYNWCGLDDIELICNPAPLDYTALQDAYNAIVIPTLGFEAGEYAPYNNIENFNKISIAKNLLDNQDADNQETIDNATAAITGMTWTANAEEVNAFFDGAFASAYSHEGNVMPIGWHGVGDKDDSYDVRLMWDYEANAGLNATSSKQAAFLKFTGIYGNETGYTLPLKAGTYKLNFIYGGWNEVGARDIKVYSAADASVEATVYPASVTAKDNQAHTTVDSWSSYNGYVVIPADGDYIFSFYRESTTSQNQLVFSDIELKKAYESANLKVEDGKLGTFVAPFDVVLPQNVKGYIAKVEGSKVKLTKIAEGGNALSAGTPIIVYGDGVTVDETFYGMPTEIYNRKAEDLWGILNENDRTVPVGAYVLQTQGEVQAFYRVNEAATGSLNRCYVKVTEPNHARLTITFEGEDPTAINAIEAAEAEDGALKDGKYIIDNKVVIVKNGVKYGANGQILK